MEPNGSVESTPTAAADAPASTPGIDDSRFSGSVAYSIDDPPAGEVLNNGGQPAEEKPGQPRNDKGQFAPKADGTEVKPVKLPESIKPPKPVDEKDYPKRFRDMANAHEELRRELRQAREELQRIQGGKLQEPQKAEAQPAPIESRIKPEDFQTYDEYVKAMVNDSIEQKKSSVEETMRRQALEDYKRTKREEFEGHAKTILQEVPHFWEIISDNRLPMTEPMGNAVMELGEMGPLTALYLASNPQDAFTISKMPPLQATIAIGKIAAKLEQEYKQVNSVQGQPSAQQNAPAQPRPRAVPDVRGGSPGEMDDQPNEKDSTEEWLRKETMRMRKVNPTAKFWSRF